MEKDAGSLALLGGLIPHPGSRHRWHPVHPDWRVLPAVPAAGCLHRRGHRQLALQLCCRAALPVHSGMTDRAPAPGSPSDRSRLISLVMGLIDSCPRHNALGGPQLRSSGLPAQSTRQNLFRRKHQTNLNLETFYQVTGWVFFTKVKSRKTKRQELFQNNKGLKRYNS